MSRCFPYPPPGFEPKLKNDHVDLSHKEKHKDKKHKKEKKDKREREEKREKDKHHSKEKYRDNSKDEEHKERKEKHKHKKREKERDKDPEKNKNRALPVLLPVPTEKTPERVFSEHSRRIDEGSQAGPPNHFVERRISGTSSHGASEKKPVPVPVQQSVPSVHKKSHDTVKVGPTSQTTNHRVTVVNGRRVAGTPSSSSPDEGMIAKKTVPNASNSNIMNPNSLMQRNSNGPSNQVLNLQGTGSTERRIPEAKKPVPSPLNSLQGKTIAPTNQSTNHPQLPSPGSHNRVASTERGSEAKRGNFMLQMQRKTDGPTFQVTNNHQAAGLTEKRVGLNHNSTVSPSALVKDKDKVKVGSNLRGSEPGSLKQEDGKKEKRKERDEKKEKDKELRRLEKKQRKEREKEEKKKKKEKERDKVKEVVNSIARPSNDGLQKNIDKLELVNSIARPSNEGLQRNIEKVGPIDGILSKKRKDGESNGFLHEDDMRAQKLVRTSPPGTPKRKHAATNGFVHENDVQSKLTKKLPPPPHLENGRTSIHPPPFPHPTIKPCSSSSPSTTATNNNPANINTIIKAEVPLIKKAPELNGTVPNAKVHKKQNEERPHPDLKYLNVVYSVPKLEEKELQPPEDDHEWLFATKPNRNHNLDPNSTMLESGLSDRPDLVWDRAVQLDSADAFALPYVVPF